MRTNKSHRHETEHIYNCLNTSKTKNVFSFQKDQRFKLDLSYPGCHHRFSPNKFYDIPSQFKSLSPSQRGHKQSSLERFTSREEWRHLSSSLDGKEAKNTGTFGINRQEYYRGKTDRSPLGPGSYDIRGSFEKKPFHMGRKIQKSIKNDQPNCTSYHVSRQSYSKLSTSRNNGTPKIKQEYYPKSHLSSYDNRVPGPGSYNRGNMTERSGTTKSYRENYQRKKDCSSFGVGQRLKNLKSTYLGPGSYNRFSQFGIPRNF